jgi:hypothetical protein
MQKLMVYLLFLEHGNGTSDATNGRGFLAQLNVTKTKAKRKV